MIGPARFLDILRKDQDLWSLYTRRPEYLSANHDAHGRYIFDSNVDGDVSIPRVSIAWKEAGYSPSYPDGKEFAIVLTHDVDILRPSIPRSLISSSRCLLDGRFKDSMRYLGWRFKGTERSPYYNFLDVMRMEEEYGAKSTFFFLMKGKDFTGAGYGQDEAATAISSIADKGWEVALHGSYKASEDLSQILEEKRSLEKMLGKRVQGYRNHYLRFRVPKTWRYLEEAGFLYDSTLGYADRFGFRNGTAHPFRPYDLEEEREMGLLEIPLALMDCTLDRYMGLSPVLSKQAISDMMSNVRGVKGTMVVLWHNDVLADPGSAESAALYRYILQQGRDQNAWLCNAEELADWWVRDEGETPCD